MKPAILAFIIASCVIAIGAQSTVSDTVPGDEPLATPSPTPAPTKLGPRFKRWFDLDAFNLITRYRYIATNNGIGNTSQQQWQVLIRGHFQFDDKARYRVNWTVNTGPIITTGFNNTGLGTGAPQTNFFVKQLNFDARPTKKLEFQVGGMEFNRGETTETISYDNDAYLTGERIVVRAPKS
ncbi:MAG TPA: hypothetical protein VGI80_06710, partial [Pyrinomonadaceae bacterium]